MAEIAAFASAAAAASQSLSREHRSLSRASARSKAKASAFPGAGARLEAQALIAALLGRLDAVHGTAQAPAEARGVDQEDQQGDGGAQQEGRHRVHLLVEVHGQGPGEERAHGLRVAREDLERHVGSCIPPRVEEVQLCHHLHGEDEDGAHQDLRHNGQPQPGACHRQVHDHPKGQHAAQVVRLGHDGAQPLPASSGLRLRLPRLRQLHEARCDEVPGGLGHARPCGRGPSMLLPEEDGEDHVFRGVGEVVVEGVQGDEQRWEAQAKFAHGHRLAHASPAHLSQPLAGFGLEQLVHPRLKHPAVGVPPLLGRRRCVRRLVAATPPAPLDGHQHVCFENRNAREHTLKGVHCFARIHHTDHHAGLLVLCLGLLWHVPHLCAPSAAAAELSDGCPARGFSEEQKDFQEDTCKVHDHQAVPTEEVENGTPQSRSTGIGDSEHGEHHRCCSARLLFGVLPSSDTNGVNGSADVRHEDHANLQQHGPL